MQIFQLFCGYFVPYTFAKGDISLAFSQNYQKCHLAFLIILTGFPKGDSPQCGEMSRSDRGDGRPLGGITLWQGCGDRVPTKKIGRIIADSLYGSESRN